MREYTEGKDAIPELIAVAMAHVKEAHAAPYPDADDLAAGLLLVAMDNFRQSVVSYMQSLSLPPTLVRYMGDDPRHAFNGNGREADFMWLEILQDMFDRYGFDAKDFLLATWAIHEYHRRFPPGK